MYLLQLFPPHNQLELLMMRFKGRSTGTYLENLWFLLADSRAAGLHSDRNQLLSNKWHKLKRQRTHRESDRMEGWRGCQDVKTAYCVFSFNLGGVTETKGSTDRQLLWNYILWKAGGNSMITNRSSQLPDLCRALLQISRHLHTAFIQEPQLSEEQRKLPQVFLELSKAILVHRLALGYTIRKLNQRYKIFIK